MPILEDIQRALRDHVRFTGDGLPNAPVAAPLPVGSPRSGEHNPSKKELRDLLIAVAGVTGGGGVSISGSSYNGTTGRITLTFTDGSTSQTGDLRGVGIASTSYNSGTGAITLTFTNGTTFTTGDLRGEEGSEGADTFATYAAALAYAPSAPTLQSRISALVSGRLVEWVRHTGAPCLGGGWAPVGAEITPLHMGLTGGEANAAPAFQAMLDWIGADASRSLVDRFIGTRNFLTELTTTGHVNWDRGVTRHFIQHGGSLLVAVGNPSPAIVPLTANYVLGAKTIAAALPVIPQRGDWLRVVSNAVNPNDRSRIGQSNKYRVQEYVQAGAGSTASAVALERPLRFTEGMSDDETTVVAAYTTTSTARLALFDGSKKFRIVGGVDEYPAVFTTGPHTIVCRAYLGPVFKRIDMRRVYGSGIYLDGTIDAKVSDCRFNDFADNEGGVQNGYGICDGGENTRVSRCQFGKCRHSYTTLRVSLGTNTGNIFSSGNTVGGQVIGCHSMGATQVAFDTHHGSVGVSFIDCKAEGGLLAGFGGRGIGHKVQNCRTYGTPQGFYSLIETGGVAGNLDRYATEFTIESCEFITINEGLWARNSRITLRDTAFRCSALRMIDVDNSHLTVQGEVSFTSSTEGGALPLPTPASAVVVFVGVRSPAGILGNTAKLTISPRATLKLDGSGFASTAAVYLSADASSKVEAWGALSINSAPSGSVFSNTASRLVTSPLSSLEVVLPSTGFTLGTATGKFVAYTSAGSAFP